MQILWMMEIFSICALCILILEICESETGYTATYVKTPQGVMRGIVKCSVSGKPFLAFKGISYAKPPIEDLRFKPPQPSENWEGVRETKKNPPPCIHKVARSDLIIGEEDCLYLNVYSKVSQRDLPVLVWFPGRSVDGSFTGIGTLGPEYLMEYNIVIVVVQFRIDVFGYLSTGDAVIQGNYGLKDQVMALQWVKNNIKCFGGDPNALTVGGDYFGCVNVGLHIFSPLTKDSFRQIICISGSPLDYSAIQRNPKAVAQNLAQILRCEGNTSEEISNCLNSLSAEAIVNATYSDPQCKFWPKEQFAPVIELEYKEEDPAFLLDDPENVIMSGNLTEAPLLIGVSLYDFYSLSLELSADDSLKRQLFCDFVNCTVRLLNIQSNFIDQAGEIQKQYFKEYPEEDIEAERLRDLFLDINYLYTATRFARLLAPTRCSPVFFFFTSYPPPCCAQTIGENAYFLSKDFIFKHPNKWLKSDYTGCTHVHTKLLTHVIVNFMNQGQPTSPESSMLAADWPPLGKNGDFFYMNISDQAQLEDKIFYKSRMKFWDKIFESWDKCNLNVHFWEKQCKRYRRGSILPEFGSCMFSRKE